MARSGNNGPDGFVFRRGLPPDKLAELVDLLVDDHAEFFRRLKVDPNIPLHGQLPPEDISAWVDILGDARKEELKSAPKLSEYLMASGGGTAAVLGLGLAFTGPLVGIPVLVSLAVTASGGSIAFWECGKVIRKDMRSSERLIAIEGALLFFKKALK